MFDLKSTWWLRKICWSINIILFGEEILEIYSIIIINHLMVIISEPEVEDYVYNLQDTSSRGCYIWTNK